MKLNNIFSIAIFAALFVFLWAGIAESGSKEVFYSEKAREHQGFFHDPEKMLPQRDHTWGPDPGGIIYDGYYYPQPYMYRPYGHPGWPGYYYPPYPPYFEPRKPWYEDEPPIPAGRLVLLVDPVEARAYVNGYSLQRHPDLSYEVGLLQGEHLVEVKAEGYVKHKRTIDIRGGERVRLTIRLERKNKD